MIRPCEIDELEKEWQQAGEKARSPGEARKQLETIKEKDNNKYAYNDYDGYYEDYEDWDHWNWDHDEQDWNNSTNKTTSSPPLEGILRYSQNCLECGYITTAAKSVFRAIKEDLNRDFLLFDQPTATTTTNCDIHMSGIRKISSICSSFSQCSFTLQEAISDSVFTPIVSSVDLICLLSPNPSPSASTDMLSVVIAVLRVTTLLKCLNSDQLYRIRCLLAKASHEFDLHVSNRFPVSKESKELLHWINSIKDPVPVSAK